jgi:hypothetical protein
MNVAKANSIVNDCDSGEWKWRRGILFNELSNGKFVG